MPLADRIRPQTLDEVVGQQHLLAPGSVFRNIADSGQIPNMIFYGPSGVGKTTVARIVAKQAGKELHRLNGTTASTADIKQIIAELDTFSGAGGILLYLDEIQYLNKKQQQTLLEFLEDGSITLIASTTENPYFYVYNAILSRSTIFEFRPVEPAEVKRAVLRAFEKMAGEMGYPIHCPDEVADYIAQSCGGDVRKSLNAVELCCNGTGFDEGGEEKTITLERAMQVAQRSAMRYDRDGDAHYDVMSALQKSIRGSDPDAAVHYLARLLAAGDLPSACRRLLVIASEDVGLAYPQCVAIVKACVDSALQLGLPEGRIPLAQAAILMATAPKSNSANLAIAAAMADVEAGRYSDVPASIKDAHYGGAAKMGRGLSYRLPHDYPDHYVAQQYLPDSLRGRVYYQYGPNKTEQAAKAYWDGIKARHKEGEK